MSLWMRNRWVISLATLAVAGTLTGSVVESATATGTPRPGEFCAAADEGQTADYVTVGGVIDHMVCEPSGNRHRWVTVSTSTSTPTPPTKPAPKPPTTKPTTSTTKVVAGPRGKTGPRGPKGATGPRGPRGYTGATGATGAAGATGPEGAQGPQGIQGPAGQGVGIPGPQGVPGPVGPAGATGPTGPAGVQGPAGTNGISGYQVVTVVGGAADSDVKAMCPTGKHALGGGGIQVGITDSSFPVIDANDATLADGWEITSSTQSGITAYVICAYVT